MADAVLTQTPKTKPTEEQVQVPLDSKPKLPHGESFFQITAVTHSSAIERKIEVTHYYSGEAVLEEKDHFPGNPIKAGVLHLESMAQALYQLIFQIPEAFEHIANKTVMFAGIDGVRFPGVAPAGSTIIYQCELVGKISKLGAKGMGKALVNGKVVCEAAELRFVFVKKNVDANS